VQLGGSAAVPGRGGARGLQAREALTGDHTVAQRSAVTLRPWAKAAGLAECLGRCPALEPDAHFLGAQGLREAFQP
jgi:hypothetical protein